MFRTAQLVSLLLPAAMGQSHYDNVNVVMQHPGVPLRGLPVVNRGGPWEPHSTPFPVDPSGKDPRFGHGSYTESEGHDVINPEWDRPAQKEWTVTVKTTNTESFTPGPPKPDISYMMADDNNLLIPSQRCLHGCQTGYFPQKPEEAWSRTTTNTSSQNFKGAKYFNRVVRQLEDDKPPLPTPPPIWVQKEVKRNKCKDKLVVPKDQDPKLAEIDKEINRQPWPLWQGKFVKAAPLGTRHLDNPMNETEDPCNPDETLHSDDIGYDTRQLKPKRKVDEEAIRAQVAGTIATPAQRSKTLNQYAVHLERTANQTAAPEGSLDPHTGRLQEVPLPDPATGKKMQKRSLCKRKIMDLPDQRFDVDPAGNVPFNPYAMQMQEQLQQMQMQATVMLDLQLQQPI